MRNGWRAAVAVAGPTPGARAAGEERGRCNWSTPQQHGSIGVPDGHLVRFGRDEGRIECHPDRAVERIAPLCNGAFICINAVSFVMNFMKSAAA